MQNFAVSFPPPLTLSPQGGGGCRADDMSKKTAGTEIERLVGLLARLPGLGHRSARKAALTLLKKRTDLLEPLAAALTDAAAKIVECQTAATSTPSAPCTICQDPRRDATPDRGGGGDRRPVGAGAGRRGRAASITCWADTSRRSTASARTGSTSPG